MDLKSASRRGGRPSVGIEILFYGPPYQPSQRPVFLIRPFPKRIIQLRRKPEDEASIFRLIWNSEGSCCSFGHLCSSVGMTNYNSVV